MKRAEIFLLAIVTVLVVSIVAIFIYRARLPHPPQPGPNSIPITGAMDSKAAQGVTSEQQCLSMVDHLPDGLSLPGALLLNNLKTYSSVLFDLEKKQYSQSPVPFQYSGNYNQKVFTSPNSKWVAYLVVDLDETGYQEKSRILHVKDLLGQEQDLSFWLVDWQYVVGWIDDRQIALSTPGNPQGAVTLLNPFTGKSQLVASQQLKDLRLPGTTLPDAAFYNTNLTYAVVPSGACIQGCASGTWTLFDPLGQRQIWEGDTKYGAFPKWSPDGKRLAIYADLADGEKPGVTGKIQVIDTLGNVTPVTNQVNAPDDLRNTFAWSPDSHTIVAWFGLESAPETRAELAVIDVGARHVTDLCLQTDRAWHGAQAPVWSPDGRYTAVSVYDNNIDTIRTIIVDIEDKKGYVVDEGIIPMGWMVKPEIGAE
jgi:hypothetical protein